MADAFYQFDKDGTGKINKAELKEMLEFQMGVALDDDSVLDILHGIDQNNDGCIDFAEFQLLVGA
eukprot:COSAG04_NODE_11174_length_725_cov_1.476038_1_plen_64_part_10